MSETTWQDTCSRNDTCGLTGAAAFFCGIPRSEVLVNGPLWCYYYALRHLEHGQSGVAQRMAVSQPDNNAIVFGTEKFLLETLDRLQREEHRPDLMLVENSCALSLIGDDLQGIVRKAGLPFPIVTMDSGGLDGGFAEGYAKASVALLRQSRWPKLPVRRGTVNVLGLTPFYYNGAADADEIVRLLTAAGYEVNAVPGCGSDVAALAKLPQAEYNLFLQPELGLPLAKALEEAYGTPYTVPGMPYGLDGTLAWLDRIGQVLPEQMDAVRREGNAARDELAVWENELSLNWGALWFDEIFVAAPGTTAVCLADAVRTEWIDTGRMTVYCQNDVTTTAGLTSHEADAVLTAGKDSGQAARILRGLHGALLLASSNESAFVQRDRQAVAVRNIAVPVKDEALLIRQPFCGLRGAAFMAQRLWNAYIGLKLADGK